MRWAKLLLVAAGKIARWMRKTGLTCLKEGFLSPNKEQIFKLKGTPCLLPGSLGLARARESRSPG